LPALNTLPTAEYEYGSDYAPIAPRSFLPWSLQSADPGMSGVHPGQRGGKSSGSVNITIGRFDTFSAA
jgi:hypothetical protein